MVTAWTVFPSPFFLLWSPPSAAAIVVIMINVMFSQKSALVTFYSSFLVPRAKYKWFPITASTGGLPLPPKLKGMITFGDRCWSLASLLDLTSLRGWLCLRNFGEKINLPPALPGRSGPPLSSGPLPEAWRVLYSISCSLHCYLLDRDLRCFSLDLLEPFLLKTAAKTVSFTPHNLSSCSLSPATPPVPRMASFFPSMFF